MPYKLAPERVYIVVFVFFLVCAGLRVGVREVKAYLDSESAQVTAVEAGASEA